jgi:hypothetical protein
VKIDEAAITMPCGADWRTMKPLGTARLCEACDRVVHNLSALGEGEARALLRRRENERLCIRYLHDAQGNVWFGEGGREHLLPPERILRGGLARVARATAVAIAPLLIEACGGANPFDGNALTADAGQTSPGTTLAEPQVGDGTEAGADGSSADDAGTDARSSDDAPDDSPGDAALDGGPQDG